MSRITIALLTITVLFSFGSLGLAQDEAVTMTYEEALACVREVLPAESYATNEFIPSAKDLENISPLAEPVDLILGLGWVQNDEFASIYNSIELGYFEDEGLNVTILEGGPTIDHLLTLGAGTVDVAISAGGSSVPRSRASTTPTNFITVGKMYNGQYVLLTTDPDLLGRELTPQDLVGRKVTVQPGGDFYIHILLDFNGIDRDLVEINSTAGFGPDALMTDPPQAHFYTGWLSNQPDTLERNGFEWNGLRWRDWAYNEPGDVFVVRAEMLETESGQEIVRRFMRASYRGIQTLVEDPETSSDITVKYAEKQGITKERALWRFGVQEREHLITGDDDLRLMEMDMDEWDRVVATLLQYGQIETECK